MMKYNVFIILVLLIFTACKPSLQKEMMKPLSEVDIYAAYPEKQMDIQQWAEVDYLPLSKKSFFSKGYNGCFMGTITEDWIVAYTLNGDVQVFDYSGKMRHTFNHKGMEEEQYGHIYSLSFDKFREEIWIKDTPNRFKVFTLDGMFKRAVLLPEGLNAKDCRNYSSDSLVCYDDYRVEEGLNKNVHPFYFFSKKDEKIHKLASVNTRNRINNSECMRFNLGGRSQTLSYILTTATLFVCKGRAVMADYAQDTIFCYAEGRTIPLLVRTPSVYTSLPFVLSTIDFMTSRFLFFGFVEKSSSSEKFHRSLLYDFETGNLSCYQLYNSDFSSSLSVDVSVGASAYPDNWLVNEISAESFLQYHREGKLKGKAADAAGNIKDTDTCILVFYKFRD